MPFWLVLTQSNDSNSPKGIAQLSSWLIVLLSAPLITVIIQCVVCIPESTHLMSVLLAVGSIIDLNFVV